jgi:hypothetical protein
MTGGTGGGAVAALCPKGAEARGHRSFHYLPPSAIIDMSPATSSYDGWRCEIVMGLGGLPSVS